MYDKKFLIFLLKILHYFYFKNLRIILIRTFYLLFCFYLGGARPQLSTLSPYLNFDPAYLKEASHPEFILPEGAGERRNRFELAFSQIGSCCMSGALLGGANGLYNGLKKVTLEGQTGKLKMTT